MKVIILAGGFGTRLSEETDLIPKPLVKIGGKPVLWHIMKYYSSFGFNRFILALGYRGEYIKDYFLNYRLNSSDFTMTLNPDNHMRYHNGAAEREWEITFINTGLDTLKGGRIKQLETHINTENFHLTYGDGVSDVDINKLINFHKQQKTLATLTAVYPPGRFGALDLSKNKVQTFEEKPKGDGTKINGGFFVLSPKVIDLIEDDATVWEQHPMETLASKGQMSAFEHNGFWQPMDTLRDKNYLEELWSSQTAPWKTWQ